MSEDRQPAEQPAAEDTELEVDETETADETEDVDVEDVDSGGDDGSDEQAQESQGPDGDARDAQPRNVGRGSRVNDEIRRSRERAQRAEAERDAFRQQLDRIAQQGNVEQLRRLEAEEEQRLMQMSPDQQVRYFNDKLRNEMRNELQQTRFQLWDQSDSRTLDELYERNPTYRKFNERVDELRRQAPTVPRRMLLATAIGLAALDNAGSARTRQETRAAASLQKQQTRPPGGGSNVAAPQRRSGESNRSDRDRRLRAAGIIP